MKDPLGSIFRRSACCLLGLGLSALAASSAGAAPVPSGFDRPPLLVLHWETVTIAAQHIDTTVVIHAGGATEITEITDGQPARMLRGNASPAAFQGLNDALTAGQIGLARGGCGAPAADGPVEYEITWYGQGTRFNTFKVGADLTSCSAGLRGMVESMVDLINAVRPSPDTQQFPRVRR
ncbi:MAG TPA: hypothetical protein VHC97_04095 [Thermoanaerobaculia bacterium]|nr:hypothetical protein [Thermoanaerobaculia bacterium]